MTNATTPALSWDRIGFAASSLCAVHCICLPLLLVAMPFLAGSWVADRDLEMGFAVASVFLAGGCTLHRCRAIGSYWLLGLALVGGTILLGAHFSAPEACCSQELSWPHLLGTALGGGVLASTHFLNLRLAKRTGLGCSKTDCC